MSQTSLDYLFSSFGGRRSFKSAGVNPHINSDTNILDEVDCHRASSKIVHSIFMKIFNVFVVSKYISGN